MVKLFNMSYVALSYIVFGAVKLCYSIVTSMETGQLLLMRFISVIAVVALAFGVFNNISICRLILALIIAATGVSGILISFFVGINQLLLKIVFSIMSIYFFVGGLMMFRRN